MSDANTTLNSGARVALVTGATGFIGSHLVSRLVRDGWQVHIVSREGSHLPNAPEFSQVSNHAHDGTTEGMIRLVGDAKPNVVFHLASLFLSQHEPRDVEGLILSNVLFGGQLLEAMKINHVTHIINTGTSWQHYENQDYSPVNLYAATKQAFQDLLAYYVDARKIKAVTLKLSDTYGRNDPRPKLLNLLVKHGSNDAPLLLSPGDQYIDIVHVSDVVQAYITAADRLMADAVKKHEIYSVTSGEPIKLKALVEKIQRLLGLKCRVAWGAREYREREVMEPWIGTKLPGWKPVVNMESALSCDDKNNPDLN